MDDRNYERLSELLKAGKLKAVSALLKPYLALGDLDARFLNTCFSVDPLETGAALDARAMKELSDLAEMFHARSLYVAAWHHFHGDDGFQRDHERFKNYLTAAALLGHHVAIKDLAELLERELNWDGFLKRLEAGEP